MLYRVLLPNKPLRTLLALYRVLYGALYRALLPNKPLRELLVLDAELLLHKPLCKPLHKPLCTRVRAGL